MFNPHQLCHCSGDSAQLEAPSAAAVAKTPSSGLQPHQQSPSMLSPSMLSPVFDPSFAMDAALLQSSRAPELTYAAARTPQLAESAGALSFHWL